MKFVMRSAVLAAMFVATATTAPGALAATIGGTVTEAEGSHAALQGVQVCPRADPYTFETPCTLTDSGGHYAIQVPWGTYTIHFDDSFRNRNLVNQSYGGSPYFPGQTVTVGPGSEAVVADARLQPGSTISGTVSDSVTTAGIEGIPICATAEHGLEGTTGRCESSGAGGTYAINGLPPGEYKVEFQSGTLNYQAQRYDDSIWPQPPTFVPIVSAGETVGGIDAAMQVGAEIAGRVTDIETGAALPGISVDALLPEAGSGWFVTQGTVTDANGEYVLRGLAEGDYRVSFATTASQSLGTCYESQFYAGSPSEAGATLVHGVPGQESSGIDSALRRRCQLPRGKAPKAEGPAAGSPTRGVNGGPAHKCRKGFHRRRSKGALRCVRRRHHHPRRRHHAGLRGT